jgi:hypothetical protein
MCYALVVGCSLDENTYLKGIKVTEEEKASISLEKGDFHGEWNYRIIPQIC